MEFDGAANGHRLHRHSMYENERVSTRRKATCKAAADNVWDSVSIVVVVVALVRRAKPRDGKLCASKQHLF